MEKTPALEALLQIMDKTGTELLITKDGQLAVVPSKRKAVRKGKIKDRYWTRRQKRRSSESKFLSDSTVADGSDFCIQTGLFIYFQ